MLLRRACIAMLAVLSLASLATQSTRAGTPPAVKVDDRDLGSRRGDHDDDDDEDVILKFSTVGDSRQDPVTFDLTTAPLSGQDAIWLQNTKAWSRIMESIHAQRSPLLFFNGDMIMGYGYAGVPDGQDSGFMVKDSHGVLVPLMHPSLSDPLTVNSIVKSDVVKFYQQYAFWRGTIAGLMERGTYVVPVPGNHETQWKAAGKKAVVENENAWRANMGDLILDDDRFQSLFGEKPANEDTTDAKTLDALATDQSKLSYSFDFRGSHFAIINTDPVGRDSHAPTNWLAGDLAAAKGRGIRNLFVFGHKPAFTYYYGAGTTLPASPSGLDQASPIADRDAFWNVIEGNGATYFCGHEHIFNMMQPTLLSGGRAWQILVGSGGSPFEAAPGDVTIHPATDRDYAWATVKIYKHGKVKITAYGFDDHFGPTHVIGSVTIH